MNDLQARKLEIAIELAGKALLAAPTPETQRACQTAYYALVNKRSPDVVKQMEARKRLA